MEPVPLPAPCSKERNPAVVATLMSLHPSTATYVEFWLRSVAVEPRDSGAVAPVTLSLL
jgi:hypothetical protein